MDNEKLLALSKHLGIPYMESEYMDDSYHFGVTDQDYDNYVSTLEEDEEQKEPSEWAEEQSNYIDFESEVEIIGDLYEYEGAEYLIYTDSEADQAFEDSIESYIDDCVIPEIPKSYRQYFDRKSFTRDCEYYGRGHTLSPYDGCENEATINTTTYYIYRTN